MTIIESLKIPAINKQRVPVKMLIDQLQPTPINKRLIESHVASIYLVSLLNEQTIHYRAYKDEEYSYQAIYVLQVTLKKDDQLTDLSVQLHSAFPEPTILLMEYASDKEWISAAPKRINRVDTTKTVLDDIVVQKIDGEAYKYLDLSKLSAINLKEYYMKVVQLLYRIAVFSIINIYPAVDLDFKTVIKEYQQYSSNISYLKERYKKSAMKAEQLDIDDQIYDEEKKQKQIIQKLRGDTLGIK
jgi:hypothetical protein